MSRENWKLEKDLCRCCLSEGSFKNLAEPCFNQGEEEVYCEMLLESLDINLVPVSGPLCSSTYTICEECILRLREACSFRRQVLLSEKRFRDLYKRDIIELHLKEEAPDSDNEGLVKFEVPKNEDDDFQMNYDDDDADNKSTIEIEVPQAKKPKPKKPKAKEKPKQPKKRTGRPRKVETKTEAEAKAEAEAKVEAEAGAEAETVKHKGSTGKFRFGGSDYTRVDNWYQCTRCEKRYGKLGSLRSHVESKHYKILCPYCDEVFMTPTRLVVHKLSVHNVDDRFKCNACNGVFNKEELLRRHINNFHKMGERYKCEFCEYEAFSVYYMKRHKIKHKTVKDHHCRFCKKAFLRKITLTQHERIHTGDRRKVCAVCGKAFVQKASLNYHMAKYHPEVNF